VAAPTIPAALPFGSNPTQSACACQPAWLREGVAQINIILDAIPAPIHLVVQGGIIHLGPLDLLVYLVDDFFCFFEKRGLFFTS
jgi:hypothetical protein